MSSKSLFPLLWVPCWGQPSCPLWDAWDTTSPSAWVPTLTRQPHHIQDSPLQGAHSTQSETGSGSMSTLHTEKWLRSKRDGVSCPTLGFDEALVCCFSVPPTKLTQRFFSLTGQTAYVLLLTQMIPLPTLGCILPVAGPACVQHQPPVT